MSEMRSRYTVAIERDASGLPERLYYSPSTPVYPAVAIESHDLTPCVLCGGIMVICGDLDLCSSCGSRRVRSQPKAAAASSDTREALAAYAHEAWSGWMRYLFSNCANTDRRTHPVSMPAWAVERWERQMNTPYADLPEDEKQSDRAEADKMLALLPAASRDTSLTAFVDDLLDLLQDVGGMSAEWCADRLARYEKLLREG